MAWSQSRSWRNVTAVLWRFGSADLWTHVLGADESDGNLRLFNGLTFAYITRPKGLVCGGASSFRNVCGSKLSRLVTTSQREGMAARKRRLIVFENGFGGPAWPNLLILMSSVVRSTSRERFLENFHRECWSPSWFRSYLFHYSSLAPCFNRNWRFSVSG